jgi:hypothetical protein
MRIGRRWREFTRSITSTAPVYMSLHKAIEIRTELRMEGE